MPDLSFCRRLFSTSVLALIVSSAIVSAPYAQAQQAPQSSPSAPQAAPEAKPANDNQQATAVQTGLPVIKTQQGVSSFQLANGLEVVVIPDHRAPVVTQMVWYRVGAADEHEGVSGIAHFLEHLMFKGTNTHKAGEFSASVAAIGGQENAFTSSDYTAYYQQVSPDALEKMMAFESDRMANLVLSDEVIVPERDVILEERRMRVDSNPGAMLGEEMNAVSYYNHPYRRPIIGWQQEMEKLSLNDALTFYQRYYTPNNAILVVAGDVTPERVRELSLKTYGTLPQRAEVAPRIRPQEPEKHTARVVTLHDSRVTQPSFRTQWLVPSYANAKAMGREKDAAALDLLGEILGGSIRSRLYQSLIVQQGIAASAGAYYAGDALDDGEFTLYGAPRGDATLEQVQQAVNDEVNRLIKDGVSDTELSQARNRFLKSVIFARDSQTGMARIYGSSLAVGQSVDDVLQWPDRIRAVTAAEVQDVAKRYLQPQIAVTGYLLPPKEATQKTAKESDSKSDAASNAPAGTAKVSAPQSEVKK